FCQSQSCTFLFLYNKRVKTIPITTHSTNGLMHEKVRSFLVLWLQTHQQLQLRWLSAADPLYCRLRVPEQLSLLASQGISPSAVYWPVWIFAHCTALVLPNMLARLLSLFLWLHHFLRGKSRQIEQHFGSSTRSSRDSSVPAKNTYTGFKL